jgi:uncharacterized protein YggU (UPF0235/DUF167 family)
MSYRKSLKVRVIPGASCDEIIGWVDGVLKVKLRAKPQDNEANEALIELFSTVLKKGKSCIRIRHGASSRVKLIEILISSEEELDVLM